MNQNKVSLRVLGVVAAGDTEQNAVRNYLRLKSEDTAIAEAGLYGVDLKGNKVGHFLVSTAAVSAPFSPLTGLHSAKKYKLGGTSEAIAQVLSSFGTTDRDSLMSAYASAESSPKVFVATCCTCMHVSASDSKSLLKHCTLCGDELPADDEGEEDIGLTITDPEVEDEEGEGEGEAEADDTATDESPDPFSSDDAADDGESFAAVRMTKGPKGSKAARGGMPDDEDEEDEEANASFQRSAKAAKSAKAARAAAQAADDEAAPETSELDDSDFTEDDAAVEDENLGGETPEEVPLVSEDDTDAEEATAEDDEECADGDNCDDSEEAPAEDEATDAAVASAQAARARAQAADDDADAPADEEAPADDDADAPADEEAPADDEDDTAEDESDAKALCADSLVTVNTLDDVVASDATPGNTATRLVFVPAAHAADSQWMALVNQVPAATVTAAQAIAANPGVGAKFSEPAFASAALGLCAQVGVRKGLKQLGFESYSFDLPIASIVEAKLQAAGFAAAQTQESIAAQAQQTAEAAVAEVAEGIRAALSASWIAHCKNFFSEDDNELKAQFYEVLSGAGVMNPAEVMESVFASSGDSFGRSLVSRAFNLLEMPVEARNQLVNAIQKANVSIPGDSSVSVASAVAHQLGNLGASSFQVQAGGDMNAAQQIRDTVASLGRKRSLR